MLAVVLVYATASLFLFWPYTPIDDAFISFRYARNLSDGLGAVFNPNQRVEGYSSLAWVLILALGDKLGADLPSLSKGLGLVLGAVTLLVLAAAPFGWRTRLCAAALLSVHGPFLYHSINGLETSLTAFLATALVLLPFDSRTERIAAPLVAGLLVITRPEGLLYVLLWQGCVMVVHRGGLARRALATSLTALVVFAAQTAVRFAYYGAWIANSARAKMMPLEIALPKGLLDWVDFMWQGGGWGVLVLLGACGAIFGAAGAERRRSVSLLLFLVLFALVLATSGGDSFPMWRFFVPLAPLLMLSAARGLGVLFATRRGAAASVAYGIALMGIAVALVLPYRSYQSAMDRQRLWARHWERIGRKLAESLPAQTTVALCPVGALPYYAGFEVIDMLGLTDTRIAKTDPDTRYYYPGHQKHDGAYVLSRQPDLVMLANGPVTNGVGNRFPWNQVLVYERDVVEDERFQRDYRLIHLPLDAKTYVGLFARREFAVSGVGGMRE